ncbi:MAG: 16S rRNA (cytidine(1402)-2'-O)-methyltransferase [Myxococcota bacterium]
MPGTLYVVGTPIGNLEDLSPRALRILREVQLVAAEDTRTTRQLLEHFGVQVPLLSCQDHNETERAEQLIPRLLAGENIALVSDAGMPGISDPGFRLTREAQEAGVPVVGIPGPCAVVTALSIAGLPTDRFLFLGFPPSKAGARRRWLEDVKHEPGTLALYESPHRILETLQSIEEVLPGRQVALGRELTKRYEELLRGSPAEVRTQLEAHNEEKRRGEMTLLIEGARKGAKHVTPPPQLEAGAGIKALAGVVAQTLGVTKREAYQALLALRGEATPE